MSSSKKGRATAANAEFPEAVGKPDRVGLGSTPDDAGVGEPPVDAIEPQWLDNLDDFDDEFDDDFEAGTPAEYELENDDYPTQFVDGVGSETDGGEIELPEPDATGRDLGDNPEDIDAA